MVSAMSPVTPKPAAEFSTLAMTKSSDSRSTSAGSARRTISPPGRPKMSPMNRMRMLANRDPDLGSAPLVDAWQRDPELAGCERRLGASGVICALEANGAREPAEAALGQVERGLRLLARRQFLSSDDQHVEA